jgi:hypothetical protein
MQSDQILLNGLGGRELPLIRIADGTILKVNVHAIISCTMESPVMQRPASDGVPLGKPGAPTSPLFSFRRHEDYYRRTPRFMSLSVIAAVLT